MSTNKLDFLTATGQLVTDLHSTNVKIVKFSLNYHGQQLIHDTDLTFNDKHRYGVIGLNGSGKSAMLCAIAHRLVPIPKNLSIYFVDREADATDCTAFDTVMQDLASEVEKLEEEYEQLCVDDPEGERIEIVSNRLDELDPDTADARVGKILHGLGFDAELQRTKCKDLSGGWRMRVSLARALFVSPDLLILDDPTSHLDLTAVVWLEHYLSEYPHTLLMTSHSQDFLNEVCTNIILLRKNKLKYYRGNYDTFVKARAEDEENQAKQYKWEQNQVKEIKQFIAKYGHGTSKMVKQAQSREKVLKKMIDAGLTEPVEADRIPAIRFHDCDPIPPPVIALNDVSFGYGATDGNDDVAKTQRMQKMLYKNVNFGIDLDSRIAIVGPNGIGKSTLIKLIMGQLTPTHGEIKRNSHLRFGWYNQHLSEKLPLEATPLEYMLQEYPEYNPDEIRKVVGRYGISGSLQTRKIGSLSDGEKARLVLAWVAEKHPHILMLDEPTNALDIETIDALANAINEFPGGLVLISHDFRLINQVAKEIWEVRNQTVNRWNGDIIAYKEHLKKEVEKDF